MDYSSESVSLLGTRISIKDGHLSTSLYRKPMDNLTMLHFSSFHPKHIKEAILYGQALCIHRICSAKNHNFLGKQTQDTTDRVPFIIQYLPRAEKLRHVLRNLQHVIDDNEHLAKIIPTPPLLAFKKPPNLKQTIFHSKLPSLQDNIDHNTTQPAMATAARHVRSSAWTLPSHVGIPPTTYMADIQVTWPMLSLAYAAGKDAMRHAVLARPCRCYNNGRMDTTQQSPGRNVPSQLGNTSAIKGIQLPIF
eukprot:g48240.t1